MNKTFPTKKIVLTALLAALVVVGSALRITIPLDIAGTTSFHLGNIMCALSGLLLGPWWGGLAAGLGSAIYDMTNPLYISEAWITFLFKGAYGLMAGLVAWNSQKKYDYVMDILGTFSGALSYAILYLSKSYFYSGLLVGGLTPDAAWLMVLGKVPATIFNAVVALIFAPVLSVAIRKALEKSHLSLERDDIVRSNREGGICPKCGTKMQAQIASEMKKRGCLLSILYIILFFVPVIGWIILLCLIRGRKSKTVIYFVCPNCGYKV